MTRGKPVCEDIRKLVISKHNSGISYDEISLDLDLKKPTVQSIIKKYKKTGSIETEVHKRGRTTTITPRDLRALSSIVKKNRRSSFKNLSVLWSEKIGKQVGREWTRKNLQNLSYNVYKAKEKPLLTALQKHKRLAWAKEKQNWVQRQWDSIIFSDESKFDVCVGDSRLKVIRKKHEAFNRDCLRRKVKFPASIMVWGCISAKGVGKLQFINGTIKAIDYINLLQNNLFQSVDMLGIREYIFQQDGAPPHTAKITKNWLQNNEIPLLNWPASSPDLSPIESVWALMKRRLRNDPAKTILELKEKIQNIWNSITPEECQELYSSMHQRCREVISTKGDVTKY